MRVGTVIECKGGEEAIALAIGRKPETVRQYRHVGFPRCHHAAIYAMPNIGPGIVITLQDVVTATPKPPSSTHERTASHVTTPEPVGR